MKMTRRLFAVTVPAALAARGLRAETLEERGKKVRDQLIEALGGQYFVAMHTRVEEGRGYSFFKDRLSGSSVMRIYTRYEPGPSKGDFPAVRERQAFGKKQDDAVLFAEGNAFEITFRGARPLPDERVTRYIETTQRNIFYILRERREEKGMIFESPGGDVVENQPVEVLDITDFENRKVRVFLHHSTMLPVMQRFLLRDPVLKERREEVTRFANYRSLKPGVQWPYSIQRERDGEKIFQLFSESVAINSDLPDKLFNLPQGITMLKKEA
jgi:hypothetical protein